MNGFGDEVAGWIKRLWVAVIVVGAFALGGIVVGAIGLAKQSDQISQKASYASLVRAFHKGERNSCIGENIKTATGNSNQLRDFRFYELQIKDNQANYASTKASQREFYLALLHVGISRKVLNRALRQQEASLAQLKAQIASETVDADGKIWEALTNCSATGGHASLPQIYSIAQKRPPASALSARNALKVDPVGGVG